MHVSQVVLRSLMRGPGIRALLDRRCNLGGGPREMVSASNATASCCRVSIDSLKDWLT